MSVFRVKKNRNFTVMSNHHLRNKKLSLKARGLLSTILSLPDDWDYTLQGLTYICREKIDAVRAAVNELECHGYIVRDRVRDEQGKLRDAEYIIYENPISDSPTLENPTLDNPMLDNPTLGNPTQLNKERKNKEKSNTDLSNTHSIPFPSVEPVTSAGEVNGMRKIKDYEQLIKDNIDYNIISQNLDKARIDELVTIMIETVCSNKKIIRVARDDFPAEVVRERLLELDSTHMEYAIDCLKENTTRIRNMKQYLLATLFNAPATIDNYFSSLVNHDMNRRS